MIDYDVARAGAERTQAQVAAELACRNVLVTFLHLIDEGRSLELPDLFAEDGVMEAVPHSFVGRKAIRDFLQSRANSESTRRTVHALANTQFRHVSATEVQASSVFAVYAYDSAKDKADLTPEALCTLEDRFVKGGDGVWRFAHHRRAYIVQHG
ncbi:MAG: nuclear transport factor 2 family protein [Sphingomonadales bacterium]